MDSELIFWLALLAISAVGLAIAHIAGKRLESEYISWVVKK